MRFFAAAIIFFGVAASYAQAPEVPRKMQFAGMTLRIRDDARQDIQKDVDALTQHSRYYTLKVERARTYFPIIEKIFEEERVPDDFKYLVLQESALVPDAVSVSNAVGFWQFKDFTAVEMGLRVDNDVDERMNLVSATRGAARYLKQSNYYFNNWIYALQSYQMGAGGVKRSVGDVQNGAREMDITLDTYWYVRKFLAHKVAFESVSHGEGQVKVIPYQTRRAQSLGEIAAAVSAEEGVLKEYNKWLKADVVPTDKSYTVLIPVGKLDGDFNRLVLSSPKTFPATPGASVRQDEQVMINGIPSIRAKPGESLAVLAGRGGVSLRSFLKYNDIAIDYRLEPGSLYLLGKKKSRADKSYGKVKPGDDVWTISQRYGVQISKLKKYNRLAEGDGEVLLAGGTIWLAATKPKDGPAPQPGEYVVELDEQVAFDWYTKSPATTEIPKITGPQITETEFNPDPGRSDSTTQTTARLSSTTTESTDLREENTSASGGQTIVHRVKSSDTLYSIARQFGVTIKDLMAWNNKKDLTLTVGEKLTIIQK